jgi:hypothetical protein
MTTSAVIVAGNPEADLNQEMTFLISIWAIGQ